MQGSDVDMLAQRIEALMAQKLRVGGKGLRGRLKRAGRRVPGWIRHDIQTLIDAQQIAAHPKLSRQLDIETVKAATSRVEDWLATVDRNKARVDMALSILGGVAISVVVVFTLLIGVLAWRGFI